ncbi:hypothetical protein BDA96_03G376400 [Sorghum bicolor]|jgi:hypothetical protein|uniref:Uncharacterized protein n=1 Tax=Sorghum bicolor TaxID=4558 RepID=A0A921RGZ8_SORBI|nr:hypothetical protein BDA96_03G376400 [Sorghum bicolor]
MVLTPHQSSFPILYPTPIADCRVLPIRRLAPVVPPCVYGWGAWGAARPDTQRRGPSRQPPRPALPGESAHASREVSPVARPGCGTSHPPAPSVRVQSRRRRPREPSSWWPASARSGLLQSPRSRHRASPSVPSATAHRWWIRRCCRLCIWLVNIITRGGNVRTWFVEE